MYVYHCIFWTTHSPAILSSCTEIVVAIGLVCGVCVGFVGCGWFVVLFLVVIS